MGASGWSYFVPYQKNVKKALSELRLKVFKSGEYFTQNYPTKYNIESYLPPGYTIDDKADIERLLKEAIELNKIPVNSIENLLKRNDLSGTHSIIDIFDIEETDDLNKSGRISDSDIIKLFKTSTPTKEIILSREMEIQTYRGRWFCTYQIVYQDNKPIEYFFTGYSGD